MSDLLSALGLSPYSLLGGVPIQEEIYASHQALMPTYSAMLEKLEREKFYHSCSQNWLNAMTDVELGI